MEEEKISLLEFEGNPNIGLYMFVNDKFAIVGEELQEEKKKQIVKVLGVPLFKITFFGTALAGIFMAGNNDIVVIPQIGSAQISKLKRICKKFKTQLIILSNNLNTYGNNICFSDKEILINPNYSSSFIKKLEKISGLKVYPIKNKVYEAIGSTFSFTNGKFFISQEILEGEVTSVLKKIGGVGTINSGSNLVSSGIVGNKNGIFLGSGTNTIEIQNILESLGYLDN